MTDAERPAVPAGFQRLGRSSGFEDLIGPLYGRDDEAGRLLGFRADARHLNPNGVVHGGMLFSLADTVLGMAVAEALRGRPCATISLNSNFVRSGRAGDWIEARASIERRGLTMVFARAEVVADGKCLCTADGVWKVLKRPPAAAG